LVGHPSSGKSSELTRLADDLIEQFDFFVVGIDLYRNVDPTRVNLLEVLFLMGAAAYNAARKARLNPDQKLFEAMVDSLNTIVRTYTDNKSFELDVADLLRGLVSFGAGLIAGPGGAAAAGAATEPLRDYHFVSGTDTEIVRKVEVEPKLRELLERMNAILKDVEAKSGKFLVLLVDGLDHVNTETAEKLFLPRFLAEPACRVLYTAPMTIYYRPQFAPVRTAFAVTPFPNVRLRHRDAPQQRDQAGHDTMRRVVHARLSSLGYEPTQVIAPEALDTLIAASGGLMRDLIRLVQDASVQAEIAGLHQVDQPTAHRVVATLRRMYKAQLTPKYEKILEQVRQTHARTEDPECDTLLEGNFVLSYSNDDIWFDVHSILWQA